jgi:voltage-gated potassium channel
MFYTSLLIGSVMIFLTVAIHAVGATLWLRHVAKWHASRHFDTGPMTLFHAVSRTSGMLLLLHFIEMVMWAVLFLSLPEKGGLKNFSEALYFSIITFTTLGYGDITLSEQWNLLSGAEAMVGITVFGLTTAMLFAVIQRVWQLKRKSTKSD